MKTKTTETKETGKEAEVSSTLINDLNIVITGKWMRIARVHDEDWLKGQVVDDPDFFIKKLKEGKKKADIFTFAQKIPHTKPRYQFPMDWDNIAAIPIPPV